MACTDPCPCVATSIPTAVTAVDEGDATSLSALHPDIIQTLILTRLDGPALASAATASSQLCALSSQERLWANLCHSTWPSTSSPRVRRLISTFPCGSRSFFSDSFTIPRPTITTATRIDLGRTPELISAVDLYYCQQLLLSRVVETETESDLFRCSPFWVDILDPKEGVQTPIRYPEGEIACGEIEEKLRLSWIVIDRRGGRAMNLSSQRAVRVKRHWLSGEVDVLFAWVLGGDKGRSWELAMCSMGVTCVGVEGGEMEVREVSMQMMDMDEMHLNGRESLGILQRALEGERESKVQAEEEGRERWREFGKRKRERKERMVRAEGTLDMLCVCLAALLFAGTFCLFAFWR